MEGGRGSGSGDDVMSGEMESALAEGRKEGRRDLLAPAQIAQDIREK